MSTQAWRLWATSEYCGVGPDGQIRAADAAGRTPWRVQAGGTIRIVTPRQGWASFRLVVEGQGSYSLNAHCDGLAVELFREFYHKIDGRDEVHPDALVPVAVGQRQRLPDRANRLVGQTAQAFWVDLWLPPDAAIGRHAGRITLSAGRRTQSIELDVEVLGIDYPCRDVVQMDYNSYGSDFLLKQYPKTLGRADAAARTDGLIELIHKYHAIVFEHHGLFHQLGYGHSGATTPLFAPRLAGDGRNRHVADWTLYDRHYGPLLDGSAFARCRRRHEPIYSIYTPFNPSWPADWLGFDQPGYRAEMVNVLRDFDAHFRANGWTQTIVEFFFNHKKRYRFYEWDGDEPRFPRDDDRFRLYRDMLDEATAGSPVQWRFRSDESWRQHLHWFDLAGVIDFWVNGNWVTLWKEQVHRGPIARGDVTWWYCGAPPITQSTGTINQLVYKTWMRDLGGVVMWLTTGVGADPWFASTGNATGLVYPGEKFGIPGPIPSVRMKVLRNAVQDVNLLQFLAERVGKDVLRDAIAPQTPLELWAEPTEAARTTPPEQWTLSIHKRPGEPDQQRFPALDPLWWQDIHNYTVAKAQEVVGG